MKKNIIYSFIMMFIMVLFTACGSDSKENPPEPVGPYAFFNATTPLVITEGMATSPSSCNSGTCPDSNTTIDSNITNETIISVQLLHHDLVKSGEAIQMKPFNYRYGFVTSTVVITDVNGNASFNYNPPVDFNAVRGQDITIQAVYLDSESTSTTPDILLTQDFVLQFR